MSNLKAKALEKGQTIGIISPASACNKDDLIKGIEYLESIGYKTKISNNALKSYNGYAGTDEERVSDINAFFKDDTIDGIFCSRGGYGSIRILDKIDYDIIKSNNKIFAGYSDITSLHLSIYQKTKLITFHAPMVDTDMSINKVKDGISTFSKESLNMMFNTLSSTHNIEYKNPDNTNFESISDGIAKGILIGGNFIVMMSSIYTEYFPELQNNNYILYIEEIDEKPYKIDRMISTLINSKLIGNAIKGIVVGDFENCDLKEGEKATGFKTAKETILERLSNINIPVLTNIRCGHNKMKLTMAHGAEVEIDTYKKTFRTLENVLI